MKSAGTSLLLDMRQVNGVMLAVMVIALMFDVLSCVMVSRKLLGDTVLLTRLLMTRTGVSE